MQRLTDPDQLYDQACARLRLRDHAGAERLLHLALDLLGDHAPALHLAGWLAGRAGRDDEATALLTRAMAGGSIAPSGLLLAALHERAGRMADAEQTCRQVLAEVPGSVEALLKLGRLLNRRGQSAAALPFLRAAADAAPDHALAHGLLAATLHGLGDLASAAQSAQTAIALAPDNPDVIANLAVIHNARGAFAQAETLCRRALTHGEDAALRNTLGIALKGQDRIDDAATAFEQALALAPDLTDALYNLAIARKDQGRAGDAVALLRKVLVQAPHLAAARFALCMAHLPPFYADTVQIDRCRADYSRELATLEEADPASLAPGVGAAQPFYLPYQGRNDVDLQRRYGTLVCRAMAAAYPPVALADRPRPGERIRIGFVSGHIRAHSVWQVPTRGWVTGLDRSRFELLAYHTAADADAETAHAQALFDHIRQGPFSTEQWQARIAADRPHVLIYPEIGMDPMVARLAALRLAPWQCTSWGHPVTSGYPTIDAFLSSAAMEPEDADQRYTERLVLLPGLSAPIAPRTLAVPVPPRATLGIPEDAMVYWSGQSPYKYLPQHDAIFAAIARQVPQSCFVFAAFPGSASLTRRFADRLAAAFAREGLEAARHCVFLPRMDQSAFHAAMGVADIVLDSIGWSGCNSLIDALAHGLPVVTLPSDTMPSRHGAAILRQMRLDAGVVTSREAYVEAAVALGRDREARHAAGRMASANLGLLADASGVAALERHMLMLFDEHAEREAGKPFP